MGQFRGTDKGGNELRLHRAAIAAIAEAAEVKAREWTSERTYETCPRCGIAIRRVGADHQCESCGRKI